MRAVTCLLLYMTALHWAECMHLTKRQQKVSWKECNLSMGERLDCGYFGITEEECYSRECCWSETREEGVSWCYHSKPTIMSKCLMNTNERLNCGYYGIRKEGCLGQNCCWQPSNEPSVPWCFHSISVPVYAGECGVPAIQPNVQNRIVGGTEATGHSWPWMVSLQGDGRHFCGGSLINSQWVLTAAHCKPGFSYSDSRSIKIGLHNQASSDGMDVEISIAEIIPHESYDASTTNNDIMLLKLERPVEFTDAITPVCLPKQDQKYNEGKHCYTTGWGDLQSHGESPDALQQVMVPLLGRDACNDEDWYNGKISNAMLCAGYEEGGRDSCQGDSGGPLVCYNEDHWELAGIVSWGYGCATEKKPGIYTNTAEFAKWVQEKVEEFSTV